MAFDSTKWSLILRVKSEDAEISSVALDRLCQKYWQPLYSWLRSDGRTPQDAEDLVQGFFHFAIESQLFQKADHTKGRLRTFLLTALRNYAAKQARRQLADKRGGGVVDLPLHSWAVASEESRLIKTKLLKSEASPEQIFEKRWALAIIDHAKKVLQAEYQHSGKEAEFEALEPLLSGKHPDLTRSEIAAKLDVSAQSVNFQLHQMKKRFRDTVRREVAMTILRDEDLDEELAYLHSILAG